MFEIIGFAVHALLVHVRSSWGSTDRTCLYWTHVHGFIVILKQSAAWIQNIYHGKRDDELVLWNITWSLEHVNYPIIFLCFVVNPLQQAHLSYISAEYQYLNLPPRNTSCQVMKVWCWHLDLHPLGLACITIHSTMNKQVGWTCWYQNFLGAWNYFKWCWTLG